jgi:hypothetical protein
LIIKALKKEERMPKNTRKKRLVSQAVGKIEIHDMSQDSKTVGAFRKINNAYGERVHKRWLERQIRDHETQKKQGPPLPLKAA